MNQVFIVAAVRTAVGSFGQSLRDVPLRSLASTVVRAACAQAGVEPAQVGHVVVGNVIPTEPSDSFLSRTAALDAGLPHAVPAFNVNRLCGSGLQAIVSATQALQLGDAEVAIAAGAESMSRSPYLLPSARWGQRMGDAAVVDYLTNVLHDPFHHIHMGMTAENVAERHGISRAMQDELAVESHRRAARAIAEGRFRSQIVPVDIVQRKQTVAFETDEHVRADASLEVIAGMKPVFKKDGTVTAGNASGIADGAAAVALATEAAVARLGLRPLARVVSYAHAGVEPAYMGIGPVPASRQALKRAGLSMNDMNVVEANEAFAAQACAVSRELDLDPTKVNPNGSGIALGHPVGATGAIITAKAVHELLRIGGRHALMTMCIGGGQGIALVVERT